ncbi:hypothetical protein PT273_01210 [Orbaceae bacterium ESL0727]|nr:hypothetical protein [Orbaceae bacterium ESL0727]
MKQLPSTSVGGTQSPKTCHKPTRQTVYYSPSTHRRLIHHHDCILDPHIALFTYVKHLF